MFQKLEIVSPNNAFFERFGEGQGCCGFASPVLAFRLAQRKPSPVHVEGTQQRCCVPSEVCISEVQVYNLI
jgi:hypothetical protein